MADFGGKFKSAKNIRRASGMVVSFNFMGCRTMIYLIYAQNSLLKERLDEKKIF